MQWFKDFLGHTTSLEYDGDELSPSTGFVTAVVDPNGHRTEYTRQAGATNPSRPVWGIKRITHPDGSHIDQTFWPNNSQTDPWYLESRTNERGKTTVYTRDALARITRKDYPNDPDEPLSYETFEYNALNEVTSHRLTNNGAESFVYDTRGLKTSWTNAAGKTTTYEYYTWTDFGGVWTDRLKKVTSPANASGKQNIEVYEYDRALVNGENSGNSGGTPVAGRGLVTKISYPNDKHSGDNPNGTWKTVGYDQWGHKLWEEDELRHRTSYTYDDYGRVLTVVTPPRFNGDTAHTTTNDYVPMQRTGGPTYTTSTITTFAEPSKVTLPSGKQTKTYYDYNWRKTQVQQAPGSVPDEANSYFYYDTYGSYTSIGNLLATKDPRNYVTRYHYDIRDRQDQITDALGSALGDPNHTTFFEFDYHGNKTKETHPKPDANKAPEVIEYDQYNAMNRLRHKKVHRDETTNPPTIDQSSMTYDAAGNLSSNTDEDGNVYPYAYDAMNRRLTMTYPNTLYHEDTSYDDAGNVKTYRNRSGATQTFSYDERNRQTGFTWDDGTTSQSTVYDAASRKTQISNADATINFAYFDDNKLKSQEQWATITTPNIGDNVHRTVAYTYDADGNRDLIQYPSGTSFNYAYTQRNQMDQIKDASQHVIVDYGFDASGNIISRALDNGTSTAYSVDAINRETSVVHNLASGTRRFDYAYSNVNDIIVAQRDSARGDGYEYDLTQQITKFHQDGIVDLNAGTVSSPTSDNVMEFDGCGNRKSLNGTPQAYNSMNQPADVPHDNNGNVQIYNGWTYTYDAQNRLRSASNPTANQLTQFWYDGLNRQCARASGPYAAPTPSPSPSVSPSVSPLPSLSPLPSVSPLPTVPKPKDILPSPTPTPTPPQFDPPNAAPSTPNAGSPPPTTIVFSVWDGDWALLEEYGPNNAITQKYLQGYHGLVKTLQDNNIYYYQDSLGSTSHIANASGNLLESYKYNLYGKPTYWSASNSQLQSSNFGVRDLHGGARWVPEIGLYDDRNRFMSPELGRFLQPDPIGFKGDASNLYRYCGNDWANRTDLLGLENYTMFPADERRHRVYNSRSASVFYIGAHGDPAGRIYDEHRHPITAQELYNRIKDRPDFQQAHAVKFLVCYAGAGENPIARQFAKVSHKVSIGADNEFHEKGRNGIIAPEKPNGAPDMKHQGRNRTFLPDGKAVDEASQTRAPSTAKTGSSARAVEPRHAAVGLQGSRPAFINIGGAQGGGTAWGEQANGSFVDAPGSTVDLSNDNGGGIGGMVYRIPWNRW